MRRLTIYSVIVLGLHSQSVLAQTPDTSAWQFGAEANNYFFQGGDYIFLPVFKADKNRLHLETRYNYEDLKTFSAWAGYNFSGGGKIAYTITPMAGFAAGQTKGGLLGLELTFTVGRFELYSESEYLFDKDDQVNNFYYNWTDLTYSPRDWWWIGLSGQRTRLYQTDLEIQRGFFLGAGLESWEFTGYVYNWGFADPFLLLTVALGF